MASTRVPSADRRQLEHIIAGLSDGIILIDPDRSIVWANESALAIHEVSELAELGETVAGYRKRFVLTYRNHHALSTRQYPMERLLSDQTFHDVVVEVRKPRNECFKRVHRLRGLILANESGAPESLVLVMQDVTERFSAEERFERAFNANPAPALICRLSDLRYIKVNQGFLEMTGYAREDVISHSVYELDVLEDAERREEAIALLNEGGTIAQREATLRLPTGDTKFVIVAGQPIEVGEEVCMLFTFIDLEPRKKVENALRHSEERFSKAFRLAPVPMVVSSADDLRIIDVNDAFIALTGYAAAEVVASDSSELPLWENRKIFENMRSILASQGSLRSHEIQLRTKSGATIDCLASADTVVIHDQPCILGVMQDISSRKRSEAELIKALDTVMQDASWFSRTVIEKLAQIRHPRDGDGPQRELAELTSREREILGLMSRGLSDAEIASSLGLSRQTIRNHSSSIYGKIGVNRRSAAIVWARERGV